MLLRGAMCALPAALLLACGPAQPDPQTTVPVAAAADGRKVFELYCSQCHHMTQRVVGPALQGVFDRWKGQTEELKAYIRNSRAYMQTDRPMAAYARALYEASNRSLMPAVGLNEAEMEALLAYIRSHGAP